MINFGLGQIEIITQILDVGVVKIFLGIRHFIFVEFAYPLQELIKILHFCSSFLLYADLFHSLLLLLALIHFLFSCCFTYLQHLLLLSLQPVLSELEIRKTRKQSEGEFRGVVVCENSFIIIQEPMLNGFQSKLGGCHFLTFEDFDGGWMIAGHENEIYLKANIFWVQARERFDFEFESYIIIKDYSLIWKSDGAYFAFEKCCTILRWEEYLAGVWVRFWSLCAKLEWYSIKGLFVLLPF